jgi:cytosine deaminase
VASGATAIRSHADTGPDIGLRSVQALLAVRARIAGVADLQVVACGALPLSGSDGTANRATLEAALDAGADVIGGAPWLDPDPDSAVSFLLELGRERNLPLDLHLDETLDPRSLSIETLLRHVGPGPLPVGRITASHVVSLGAQAEADQVRIARAIAAAGVGVVALPRSNLYLQGRGLGTSTPRGITAVGALLAAGAVVAGGGDNLRDPFTPIGRPDVLETASLLVSAGHLSPEQALTAVTVSARCVMGLPPVAVRGGSPADLVAIRATSLVDAVGGAHSERLVFKSGRLVAHTRVVSEVAL